MQVGRRTEIERVDIKRRAALAHDKAASFYYREYAMNNRRRRSVYE